MRKSGLTGDEAYVLSKHGKTTEDLGPLKKEIGKLKEDLSNKITKFYASNQGETHITDSDNGKIMDMVLYGKSEQKSTMGKNLLKLSELNVHGATNGLLPTMNADGSISVTGTSTSTWSNITKINNECHTDNATYTFSADKNSDVVIGLKLGRTKLDDANYQTHRIMQNQLSCTFETGASNEYCSLFLEGLTVGKSYNFTIYPMLELGTEATAYEPYTGGQPSPSPDYPQEIKSVVNPVIKICGKNLFDSKKFPIILNRAIDTNTGKVYESLSGNYCAIEKYIHFPYSRKKVSFNASMTLCAYDKDYKFINTVNRNNGQVPIGTMYVRFDIKTVEKDKAQIELSENATTYEPYKEQTIQLTIILNSIPVSSGGNVTINGQQYIADYVDVERGKYVQMIQTGKVPSNAVWNIQKQQTGYSLGYTNIFKNGISTGTPGMEKTWKSNVGDSSGAWSNVFSFGRSNVFWIVPYENDGNITSNDINAWLVEHPMDIMYPLAEPIETDLPTEQITAFKALATYYPTTNISVNSEQLDGYTVFNYPISMANGWNYVKQQLNDNRDYIYDMDTKTQDIDTQAAEAYVNSEYAVTLTELEV